MSTLGLLRRCEAVLENCDALDRCAAIESRRREDQEADLRLLFSDRGWLHSAEGDRMLDTFGELPMIAHAARRRSALLLRFEDSALVDLEWRLACEETTCLSTTDILAGRQFTVSFVGPNTNKALHVGHLRNVFLGEALASALVSAGASVRRHTLVGDIGRRVCEAMGGYVIRYAPRTPSDYDMPGDQFVELCSRKYTRDERHAQSASGSADREIDEREPRGDLADKMMQAWLEGAEYERDLWHRLREWVLGGHERTLARLGVTMDDWDFESEGVERALALVAAGIESGTLTHDEDGAVVYRTGRSEYTTMVLLRKDGVPTEYARLLGAYHRILGALEADASYLEVAGIEWQQATMVLRELLKALPDGPEDEAYTWILHGSVTERGRKMGSSTGEVVWIDDLLDRVAASSGVASLQELADGALGADEIADVVVRGTFLCSSIGQPLEFALAPLLERGSGHGWTIAEAWCRAQHPARPQRALPVARTALVQSQLYRRSLAASVGKRDVSILAGYLLCLAEASLASSLPGPAVAPVLRCVLQSLGFLAGRSGERGDLVLESGRRAAT